MLIKDKTQYQVYKYKSDSNEIINLGLLLGKDIKPLLKNYKYDYSMDMWFSKKCKVGYEVVCVNNN